MAQHRGFASEETEELLSAPPAAVAVEVAPLSAHLPLTTGSEAAAAAAYAALCAHLLTPAVFFPSLPSVASATAADAEAAGVALRARIWPLLECFPSWLVRAAAAFGRPPLAPSLAPERDALLCAARMPLETSLPAHAAALRALYVVLSGAPASDAVVWTVAGFQRPESPASDLRAAGMLAPLQLLWLAGTHGALARRLASAARSGGWPLALAAVAASASTAAALRAGKLNSLCNAARARGAMPTVTFVLRGPIATSPPQSPGPVSEAVHAYFAARLLAFERCWSRARDGAGAQLADAGAIADAADAECLRNPIAAVARFGLAAAATAVAEAAPDRSRLLHGPRSAADELPLPRRRLPLEVAPTSNAPLSLQAPASLPRS